MKSYSELITLPTLKERFEYLQLNGFVGSETFGSERFLNQMFYRSAEWKEIRNRIIVRDYGGELGLEDFPIKGPIYIHHINPLLDTDIIDRSIKCLDPDQLICCSLQMHNALHYGNSEIIRNYMYTVRMPNDTKLW